MTYAGRLDPMANGVLLILAGDETKNKEKYLALSKEYEFKILFGFATDTYDILGKITSKIDYFPNNKSALEKEIKKNIKYFRGKFVQNYPVFSSKTVKGKPLFWYAREGKSVEPQSREVFVKSLALKKISTINGAKLLQDINKRINKVDGDFRQEEILKIWQKNLASRRSKKFFIAELKIKCSTGTYVRGIAHSLGEKMGIPVLAFTIKRTKIGKWSFGE